MKVTSRWSMMCCVASFLAGCFGDPVSEIGGPEEEGGEVAEALEVDTTQPYSLVGVPSGKCVQPAGGSASSTVQAEIATCNGTDPQQFRLSAASRGLYSIKNEHSGLCLGIIGHQRSDGAGLVQDRCTGAASQQFVLRDVARGAVRLVARHSGKVLDISGHGTADGTKLVQRRFSGSASQQFKLVGPSSRALASDLGLTEADCRCCHGPVLADRHHLLVIKRSLECLTCHQMLWNPTAMAYEAQVIRNCPQCHTGSLADRHHLLVNQVTVTCFTCHALVWDPVTMMYVTVFNNSCNVPPPPPVSLATINGTVKDISGAGLAWVQISSDTGQYSTLTTATGAFQLADVAAGSYVLTASATGYVAASRSITVVGGQTAVADFVLSPVVVPATISGQVLDARLAPVSAARVSVGSGLYSAVTDVDGNFVLTGVAAGSYVLTAEKAGYGSSSKNISVTSGQALIIQFGLPDMPSEVCDDAVDNNANGLVDCADPACSSAPGCAPPVEICGDGIDNDANGFADCADSICRSTSACPPPVVENCGDGVDNDNNGLADCKDPACVASAGCQSAGREICGDGIDNDKNHLIDCRDPACLGVVGCSSPIAEVCQDGVDNNGDGLLDCADPLCFASHHCLDEKCGDGVDNDHNRLVDCADPACAKTSKCLRPPVDICNDGLDNDGDGKRDCDDAKCSSKSHCAHPVAEEVCGNHIDDNADGMIDCADAQCKGRSICLKEICGNGRDDDQDGVTDCADSDCVNRSACAVPTTPRPLSFSARASDSADGYGVEKLADGRMHTHWRTHQNHDAWVRLELGGVFRVSEVDIGWYTDYARRYKVKVSKDGRYWRAVKEIDRGNGHLDTLRFDAQEARSILIELEDSARSGSGYSISEIQVFQDRHRTTPSTPDGGASRDATSVLPSRNLALNASVSASDSAAGYVPRMAVDAQMGTRWKAAGNNDQWIRVDLGSTLVVGKVIVDWHWEHAADYKVKVSLDGSEWKTVMELKHGHGGRETITFPHREARYVQIDCEYAAHGESSGGAEFSIYELEVFSQ